MTKTFNSFYSNSLSMGISERFIGSISIDCSFETIIGTPFMYSSLGSGLTIAIIEPIIKTQLYMALRNILKRTVFDVEH